MDLANSVVWFAIAVVLITTILMKIAGRRIMCDPTCYRTPAPPVVNGGFLVKNLHTLITKGMRAMIHDQYTMFGSVFTVSILGKKITFLIGPEVSGQFYQGFESDISHGNSLEFMVPMFGKEVGFGVDFSTRYEQIRLLIEALKPSKLKSHIHPMIQEVEEYFAKWGHSGTVDFKYEFEELLMLIASRCLLGKEVREKMHDEIHMLFRELDNGMNLASVLFPYAPIPSNHRRDAAHTKLKKIFTQIVRSRKSSNQVEADVLQILIDSKYKDGRPTTEVEVTGLIMMLLFGGKHTSSQASTWTGACLLSNENWLKAAVEEQKEIVRKYGDHMDWNVLLEMDTLHNSIKEALRMHPPTSTFVRKVHKSFTVRTKEGHEYEIPKGHTIASPVIFNNTLPYIYKDPDVYDPERFSSGRQEDKVGGRFSYTVFGGGRHTCAGEAYAYMQIKVLLCYLLWNFELTLLSPFPETDWSKLVPEPKGKVMVSYKRKQLPRT